MARRIRLVALLAALLLAAPVTAAAQIVEPPLPCPRCPIVVPDGPVVVESYDVTVTIDTQVATTRITQVLRNDGHWLAEGVFLMPLPRDAAVSDLVLWIDNEPVTAELLDRDEARRIYEDIVRTLRDPALLEWADHDLVRLSVFPIPEGDTRKVEVSYTEVLPADAGLLRYTQAFGAEHGAPIESLTVTVDATSTSPINAIYSPSHTLAVSRDGDRAFTASVEATDVAPDEAFSLFYSVGEDAIGVDLLTYLDPDDGDGFFLLLVNPEIAAPAEAVARDVIFVLDRSGSMEGEKFTQARAAVRFVLEHLNPQDHFNVVTFSTDVTSYSPTLVPADEAADAADWVDGQSAGGATDINRALLEAFSLTSDERPAYVIFLTDGLPTEGVTQPERIINNVGAAAPDDLSLFGFGVGVDVDAFLLDSLAADHHGTSDYVLPGESIDETVSGFYAKVSTPVLTGIEIDFGPAGAYDIHPAPLPDLFAGEQLIVAGRYRTPGTATVTLTGRVGDARAEYVYDGLGFGSGSADEFVPRLWATRKIGDLLREMRLQGVDDETVEQVVALSVRYGIVTPFTSFLVEEPGLLTEDRLGGVAEEFSRALTQSLARTSGADAVAYSDDAGSLSAAEAAPPSPDGDAAGPVAVRTAGGHTFRLVDGVWVDTTYDPETMTVQRVPFLSDGYFALAGVDDHLAEALALGEAVIVVRGGVAYEVVGADETGDDLDLPQATPSPAEPTPPRTPAAVTVGGVPVTSAAAAGVESDGDDAVPPWLWGLGGAGLLALGGAVWWRRARA